MGMESGELDSILKGMMKKGLVVSSVKNREFGIFFQPGLTGFFELPLCGRMIPSHEAIGGIDADIPEYTRIYPGICFPGTSRGKAYIYSGVLPKVKSEVLRFDEAAEHIKMAGRGSLGKCYCRHEAWHLGKNCSAPIDDICMSLGNASDFLVEQGFARRASVDELLSALKRAEDLGLVHIGDNVQDQTTFICNCCGCCCGFLEGITKHHLKHAVTTTNYIARLERKIAMDVKYAWITVRSRPLRWKGIILLWMGSLALDAEFAPTSAPPRP